MRQAERDAGKRPGLTTPAAIETIDAINYAFGSTTTFGVNNQGDVTGDYYDGMLHGFTLIGGPYVRAYATVDPPGSAALTMMALPEKWPASVGTAICSL